LGENPFNSALFTVALLSGTVLLLMWILPKTRTTIPSGKWWNLAILLIFALGPLIELTFFVAPYRQTPRYYVPFWPLMFLLFGAIISIPMMFFQQLKFTSHFLGRQRWILSLFALVIVAAFSKLTGPQISDHLAFPTYDQAFLYVKQHWQPGDIIVTPYTAASGLYLGQVDYFPGDIEARSALLATSDGAVDRYWGAPWLKSGRQLQSLLETHPRVWFVIMDWLYTAFYRADWHFVSQKNMKLAWTNDSVSVYVNNPEGIQLPIEPLHPLDVNLGSVVKLQGYTSTVVGSTYRLFLFWKVMAPIGIDLTQFVHIRNHLGENVAQADFLPLGGEYPTSRWRVDETVVDVVDIPIPANLPVDEYRVLVGLYHWKTLERLVVINDFSGENAIEIERLAVDF
jgi:hypothetical protein